MAVVGALLAAEVDKEAKDKVSREKRVWGHVGKWLRMCRTLTRLCECKTSQYSRPVCRTLDFEIPDPRPENHITSDPLNSEP